MLQALRGSYPLLFCVLPLGGIALAVVGLLFDFGRCPRWLRAAPPLVLPVLALAVNLFDLLDDPGCRLALEVLAAACGACYFLRGPVAASGARLAWAAVRHTRVQWCILLVASLAAGGVWLYGEDPTQFPSNDLLELFDAERDMTALQPASSARAYSDRGRSLTLYAAPPLEFTKEKIIRLEKAVLSAVPERVIRMGPAEPGHNCHGWTFTGGAYWIKGRDVDVLLEDNGYQPVADPRVNDLVVYRDKAGQVSHSGVIRTVLPDGEFLLESKWGWAGRFIHTHAGHVYGTSMTVYRSSREGHRVQISTDSLEPPQHRVY